MQETVKDHHLLDQEIARLEWEFERLKKESDTLKNQVAHAKYKESIQPQIAQALEQLQKREHERSVGVFSKLLTALVKEVLPQTYKPIHLNLYTSHGQPALDIEVRSNHKHAESITSGALLNILSVGLRLIAIARTKQRRFLVLDEPDHWIKPENIPEFTHMLDKIIKDLGFQILLISHHQSSFFSQVAKCVHLTKNESGEIETQGDLTPEDHQGLQAIRLENFESHSNTLIPLHAGITVLTGDNFLGKSSVTRGLKALFSAEALFDKVIKHTPKEEAFCRVEVKLETGEWVGWRRTRKLNTLMRHKNRYYLRQDTAVSEEEFDFCEDTSESVPDFIQSKIQMSTNGQWDLHIADQEGSVFLLNKATKPTDRAKILSLGNESQILHGMLEANRLESRENKEIIRNGEKKLSRFIQIIEKLEQSIQKIIPKQKVVHEEGSKLKKFELKKDDLDRWIQQYKACSYKKFELDAAARLTQKIQNPPQIKNEGGLKEALSKIKKTRKWAQLNLTKVLPEPVQLKPVDRLIDRISKIKQATRESQKAVLQKALPSPPNLNPTDRLTQMLNSLRGDSTTKLKEEEQQILADVKENEESIHSFWKEHQVCPTCLKPHQGDPHA